MIRAIKPVNPKPANFDREPALKNPTVSHCWQTWVSVHNEVYKSKNSGALARIDAAMAFRRALPELNGFENICNFIACVTFGMNAGILREDTVAKLLYASQVALNTLAAIARIKARGAGSEPLQQSDLEQSPSSPASTISPAH